MCLARKFHKNKTFTACDHNGNDTTFQADNKILTRIPKSIQNKTKLNKRNAEISSPMQLSTSNSLLHWFVFIVCRTHTHNSMVHYMTRLLFMRKITMDLTSEIWRESILNRTHFTLNTIELKGNISKLPWSSQFLLYRSFSTFVFIHF